jgi:spore coat polysaccharide biosynthesis protein SpsF
MAEITAVLQARASSRRLPGKVLRKIAGKPMLALQIDRVRRAQNIELLTVATSTEVEDDAIASLCDELNIECFRGSLNDVLDRVYTAAAARRPDYVVRLTGDCPLSDPTVIDAAIEMCINGGFDYVSNAHPPSYPDGLDVEVVRFSSLEIAWQEAKLASEREHVLPFVWNRAGRFKSGNLVSERDLSHLRWTVDEPADLEFVSAVYDALYHSNPEFTTADVLELLHQRPEIASLNNAIVRNEGYHRSLAAEARSDQENKSA